MVSPAFSSPPATRFGSSRAWLFLPLFTALSGCQDIEEEKPPLDTTVPEPPAVAPQKGALRLSVAQYRNSVRDVFGQDIAVPTALEPDTSLGGFVSIGSAQSAISPRGVEQYEDAAFKIAAQALATPEKRAALVPCKPASPSDDECARAFITDLGRKVWRRPLEGDEVTALAAVITSSGTTLGDFYLGAEFGIASLLQAPSFIYRSTVGEPDPDRPGENRLTSYEMASRLSYFLWNSTPDVTLLDAADRGELTDPAAVEREVERLVADPRARAGLRNFVTEYLRLDKLDALSKDPKIFTYYSPEVGPAAREETLLTFEYAAFQEDGDFRDLFTSRFTFVNPKLASIYQVLAPNPEGFARVELPADVPRRGLLGQVSFLALYAHPTSSSATLRGKLVREVILCGTIPPPPVDVNTALPEPSPDALTLRDRVAVHLTDTFCASCHNTMDPIGLGMENFDGIGRYRTKENGALIDASGDLDGATFSGPSDLAERVRNHPDLAQCFVRRMYQYATSFEERASEDEVIAALTADFEASGHRIRHLMFSIATSPGFRLAGDAQ
jgi:hypothetical protein